MGYTMIKYIECRNLTLEFEKNNKILDNINIFMDKGKIYGFVGRNGCGKTMLFRTICGFVKPIMGEVIVDGKIIGKDTEFIRNDQCGHARRATPRSWSCSFCRAHALQGNCQASCLAHPQPYGKCGG